MNRQGREFLKRGRDVYPKHPNLIPVKAIPKLSLNPQAVQNPRSLTLLPSRTPRPGHKATSCSLFHLAPRSGRAAQQTDIPKEKFISQCNARRHSPQKKLRRHQGGEPKASEVLQSRGEGRGPCPALGSSRDRSSTAQPSAAAFSWLIRFQLNQPQGTSSDCSLQLQMSTNCN